MTKPKEPKHSPAPWHVEIQVTGTRCKQPYTGHIRVTSANNNIVVGMSCDDGFAQALYNASVISAAPEMLALLKKVYRDAHRPDKMRTLLQSIRIAIIKAERKPSDYLPAEVGTEIHNEGMIYKEKEK
jgi:hypothetical protein